MSPKRQPRKRRVPKLMFTTNRGIGWHVSYRDPETGMPKKHAFGVKDKAGEAEATRLYYRWLAEFFETDNEQVSGRAVGRRVLNASSATKTLSDDERVSDGSLLEVASAHLRALSQRVRGFDEPRRRGTISASAFGDRRHYIRDFLSYINTKYGPGTAGRMGVWELTMPDVESYNASVVARDYSVSEVRKRMQMVKALIDRAGRPEHGEQVLRWNWDARDVAHGKPSEPRIIPTTSQLVRSLRASQLRQRTLIWMGLGLGFGQRDLAQVRVGQIDALGYDLRRSKTGIERYGVTPPIVSAHIEAYIEASGREDGELLFVTHQGQPLVHGRSDSVRQWWARLRAEIGESKDTMGGFYTLRHLGATEFGSREGCSIGEMRRWLGHGASSRVADVYMRPVTPELREVVEWVRDSLQCDSVDMSLPDVIAPS